jgi:hypothetical protein
MRSSICQSRKPCFWRERFAKRIEQHNMSGGRLRSGYEERVGRMAFIKGERAYHTAVEVCVLSQ